MTIGSSENKLKSFCLIGMSGVGKSYWSELVKDKGYQRFSCDEFIFKKLEKKLPKNSDFMLALSNWLGYPDDSTYQERAAEYLRYENLSIKAALDFIDKHELSVIDSSGSLIFCEDLLIQQLKTKCPLVYLESNQSFYQKITDNYVNNPKPLIWSEEYSYESSLTENFQKLIEFRANKYYSNADIIINSEQFKHAKTSDDFLEMINHEQATGSTRSHS